MTPVSTAALPRRSTLPAAAATGCAGCAAVSSTTGFRRLQTPKEVHDGHTPPSRDLRGPAAHAGTSWGALYLNSGFVRTGRPTQPPAARRPRQGPPIRLGPPRL